MAKKKGGKPKINNTSFNFGANAKKGGGGKKKGGGS